MNRSADATFDRLDINVRRSQSGLEDGERRIVGCLVGKMRFLERWTMLLCTESMSNRPGGGSQLPSVQQV